MASCPSWRWPLLWVSEECSPAWMTGTATEDPSGGCRTREHWQDLIIETKCWLSRSFYEAVRLLSKVLTTQNGGPGLWSLPWLLWLQDYHHFQGSLCLPLRHLPRTQLTMEYIITLSRREVVIWPLEDVKHEALMRSVALGFCVRILMYVAQHDQWVLPTVQHGHQGAAGASKQWRACVNILLWHFFR